MSYVTNLYEKLGPKIISRKQIHTAVKRIAKQINNDFNNREVTLISNLKGSFRFVSDLISHLKVPIRIGFVSFRSYKGTKRIGKKVVIDKDLDLDIKGRHVIIIEDIVDSGLTMDYSIQYFKKQKKAKSVKICTLLDKEVKRQVPIKIDYCGFKISDFFLVGYGLDYDEYFRELNDISVFKQIINGEKSE